MSEENERDYLLAQIHQLEHENEALEEEIKLNDICIGESNKLIIKLQEQNAKYRAALEFYADKSNWCDEGKRQCHWSGGVEDGYELAQQALKGKD